MALGTLQAFVTGKEMSTTGSVYEVSIEGLDRKRTISTAYRKHGGTHITRNFKNKQCQATCTEREIWSFKRPVVSRCVREKRARNSLTDWSTRLPQDSDWGFKTGGVTIRSSCQGKSIM